jgi:hypothetical protein
VTEQQRLQKAIRELHGVEATHLRSEPVREVFRGQTVWEGTVEVFKVEGHPTAELAFAWSYETDDGKRRTLAVLGIPPVHNARDAVRVAIAAKQQD